MKCKNCGHENPDGKNICESCGKKLEKRKVKRDSDRIEMKDIRSKRRERSKDVDMMTFGMIFAAILIFALIAIVFSYFTNMNSKDKAPKEETKVEETTKSEDTNKGSNEDSREELYQKALDVAKENIEKDDYENAARVLFAIPEGAGKYYDQGQKELKKIEEKVTEEIKSLIEAGDFEKAKDLRDSYKKYFKDSEDFKNLSKDIDKNLEDDNTTSQEENEESPSSSRAELSAADLERLRVNNSYGQNGNPSYTEIYSESDFLNKNVTIDAHMGEVRTEPNLDSGVAGYVNDGESVYVEEVYNDGGRYWLNIGNGWISSKLVTGEFSQN